MNLSDVRRTPDYYLKPNKFIRDHAHEYIFLTDFELSIVDTIEFQRLKDVRQLTCQHVFPGARHTRFEHSLGVMELTRRALNALNSNGYMSGKTFEGFDDNLIFNATLAALLHDVGHCPFSHLGEREFNKDDVWIRLYNDINEKLKDSSLQQQFESLDVESELNKEKPDDKKIKKMRKSYPGAIHEQMSCCVILESMYDQLSKVEKYMGNKLCVDFELICRCILGKEYDISLNINSEDESKYKLNLKKNTIVHLISSHVFDMDKLDYIMRDSCMTGIGAPNIDTNRLFRNMYLNDDCAIVFSNRAVPVLQNMVDSRDELYMYVYNHHAVIFSDFMYTYIFRRLAHNDRDINAFIEKAFKEVSGNEQDQCSDRLCVYEQITNLGSVSKNYLFSPGAILEENRSDGDLTSLLNVVRLSLKNNGCDENNQGLLLKSFIGLIDMTLTGIVSDDELSTIDDRMLNKDYKGNNDALFIGVQKCLSKIKHTYEIVDRYMRRDYLKPWWKTYSEFNLFINHNFPDDNVRRKLCDWICNGSDEEPAGDEFRSQLAKHVAYITHDKDIKDKLYKPLEQGDFFIIERSAKFFDPETLKELEIAQKTNEITSASGNAKYRIGDYYIKELPQIIPQKDYYSVYAKNSFYVFSKRLEYDKDLTAEKENHHYQLIEQIFVFVATELVRSGKLKFQSQFGSDTSLEEKHKNEKNSKEQLCSLFKQKYLF